MTTTTTTRLQRRQRGGSKFFSYETSTHAFIIGRKWDANYLRVFKLINKHLPELQTLIEDFKTLSKELAAQDNEDIDAAELPSQILDYVVGEVLVFYALQIYF